MKTSEKTSRKSGGKRFDSVLDLVKATSEEPERVRKFEEFLADTRITRALVRARARAGITQAELAERMGCTQSAVSKLEHSSDGDLKISEIASYVRATDERIAILFGSQPTIAERIKAHVIGLRREIGKLAEMADENDDEQLRRQINKFGEEAWFNMLVMLLEAAAKFAPHEPEAEEPIRINDYEAETSLEAEETVPA